MLSILLILACTDSASDDSGAAVDWDEDGHVSIEAGGDDCNDRQPSVYPGAPTTCGDGIDNDCDGDAVEDHAWFPDADGDGFGAESGEVRGCSAPGGHVADNSDCDDADPALNPNTAWYQDVDGDGYGDDASLVHACEAPYADVASVGGDCDDSQDSVFPGAPAICDDGIVQDCAASDEQEACGAAMNFELRGSAVLIRGTRDDEQLGTSVAWTGDQNGDGLDDFAVGAPRYDDGRAYLYTRNLMGELDTGHADFYVYDNPERSDAGLGGLVAGLGDLDGDGDEEWSARKCGFILREYAVCFTGVFEGFTSGSVMLTDMSRVDTVLMDSMNTYAAGWSIAGGQDIGGSYRGDVVMGGPVRDGEDVRGGAAIYFGPLPVGQIQTFGTIGEEDVLLEEEVMGDQGGLSVAQLRDFNGDGDADLLIGAPRNDRGGEDSGAVYLFIGPVETSTTLDEADFIFVGERAGDNAGFSVASGGDIDSDGYDDALVGAPFADGDDEDSGAAYALFGRRGTGVIDLSNADARWVGEGEAANAGYALDGAGDIDRDGHDEVLIGSPTLSRGGALYGGAYLIWGGAAGGRLADAPWRILGEAPNDLAGYSVDGGGDFDGDGVPDLLIGAPGSDEVQLAAGSAYLILGTAF